MNVYTPYYFDDLDVGDRFTSSARTITETDLTMFAMLSSDWNPVHTDAESASRSRHGERIAHGILGVTLATGLFQRTGMFDDTAIALLSIDNWTFSAPLKLADTVHAIMEITDLKRTSRGDRGIVTRRFHLINQHKTVCQQGTSKLMALAREPTKTMP